MSEPRAASESWQDIAGYDLGAPRAVARPKNEEQVAKLVTLARRRGIPLVAMGRRTAYWRALHLDKAIALDVSGLRGIQWGVANAWVGAGTPVRELDNALRARGYHLPLHPDAYGETSLGAMVATACTSGIGMGSGSMSSWVNGLCVVTGQPEIIRTGSAGLEGTQPFVRDGLPDLTGLFFGAEGGLGVITRVALSLRRAPHRVCVRGSCGIDQIFHLAALARKWGAAQAYDTMRAVYERGGKREKTMEIHIWAQSPWSAAEAAGRAQIIKTELQRICSTPVSIAHHLSRRRWSGPIGGHDSFIKTSQLSGIDVNASYADLPRLWKIARRVIDEQMRGGATQCRGAVYFSPDFVNLGIHATFARNQYFARWCHDHMERWLAMLTRFPVVPYRFGRVWPRAMLEKIPVAQRELLYRLKAELDPDSIMNPGLTLFQHG